MEEIYDNTMRNFDRRYRIKKTSNLCITAVTAVLGITSFRYGLRLESMKTILRWMTVDGTLFTTFGALAFLAVNLWELLANTEMTRRSVYFLRLSSAVAETVIFLVVIISQIPFFTEHIPFVGRYDHFAMHMLIPILSVSSFLVNDSPLGKLKPLDHCRGTWFVTCYGVTIFTLISTNTLPEAMIPYFFLNYRKYAWVTVFSFDFIYGIAYFMSRMLSEWNRKLSWLWFKDIAREHMSGKSGA